MQGKKKVMQFWELGYFNSVLFDCSESRVGSYVNKKV